MDTQLSPWWRRALVLLMVAGFTTLGYLAARSYRDAPPIPARVVNEDGATLFTGEDIIAGQQILLSHGLRRTERSGDTAPTWVPISLPSTCIRWRWTSAGNS